MPDPLTISAAARICHCDRRTIQRAIHAGRLHLDAQHCLSREDLLAAGYLVVDTPQETPQEQPHIAPQETPQTTPPLALLERLAIAVEGVWQELRRLQEYPRQAPQSTPQKAATVPQGMPQETPRRRRPIETVTPQETPHDTPQAESQETETAGPRPHGLTQENLAKIAEVTARYKKLSLADLSQMLFDRNVYRARDRKTGEEKPVNRGTLGRWLAQAREAGML